MKKTLLTLAISGAMTVAYAADSDFDSLDVNLDGYLTQEEMAEYSGVVQHWSEIDNDGDGMIDNGEFKALVLDDELATKTGWASGVGAPNVEPGVMGDVIREFAALDTDGDGMLSRDEMQSHEGVVTYWGDIDRNQDDYLDSDEFAQFEEDDDLMERTGWIKMPRGMNPAE